MKTIKKEIALPIFPGFYDTIFEYNNEEMDIENYNEKNNTNLDYEDFDWDHPDYHKRVSKKINDVIEKEITDTFTQTKLTFKELDSPRFYNYRNDEIISTLEMSENNFKGLVHILFNTEYREDFEQFIKDRFTSYDGFVSFLSNDINVWESDYLNENYKRFNVVLTTMLEFWLTEIEGFSDLEVYERIMDEMYINYEVRETENV